MFIASRKGPFLAVAAVALLAAGCASKDDLARTQSQADQARSQADQASQAAQAAQRSADENRSQIDQLNQKMQEIENRKRGERG
jgi:hypothetical protein